LGLLVALWLPELPLPWRPGTALTDAATGPPSTTASNIHETIALSLVMVPLSF